VPSRQERLAQNETRFREINEAAQPMRVTSGSGRFVCECADRSCMAWLTIPGDEYEAVRQDPRRFIVAPTHELPDIETVVARHQGYVVVEKPPGVDHIVGPDPA
jgi:hypothetical protein